MKLFSASDARRRFGQLLKTARREPVTITKNGRSVAMMFPALDDQLNAAIEGVLEERYWCEMVADAERAGYIGVEESNRILSEALNAED